MEVKPPALIGVAAALLILLASLIAPHLRGAAQRARDDAQNKADLAIRELYHVDPALPRLEYLSGVVAANEAELSTAGEAAGPEIGKVSTEYAQLLRAEAERARKYGHCPWARPAPKLP